MFCRAGQLSCEVHDKLFLSGSPVGALFCRRHPHRRQRAPHPPRLLPRRPERHRPDGRAGARQRRCPHAHHRCSRWGVFPDTGCSPATAGEVGILLLPRLHRLRSSPVLSHGPHTTCQLWGQPMDRLQRACMVFHALIVVQRGADALHARGTGMFAELRSEAQPDPKTLLRGNIQPFQACGVVPCRQRRAPPAAVRALVAAHAAGRVRPCAGRGALRAHQPLRVRHRLVRSGVTCPSGDTGAPHLVLMWHSKRAAHLAAPDHAGRHCSCGVRNKHAHFMHGLLLGVLLFPAGCPGGKPTWLVCMHAFWPCVREVQLATPDGYLGTLKAVGTSSAFLDHAQVPAFLPPPIKHQGSQVRVLYDSRCARRLASN